MIERQLPAVDRKSAPLLRAASVSPRRTIVKVSSPVTPLSVWQLYVTVPSKSNDQPIEEDQLPLNFGDPTQLLNEGATLAVVARVNIPTAGGNFELQVDLTAKTLVLREAPDGTIVSRDGLWAAEAIHARPERFCLGVTLAGTGASVTVLP